MDPLISIIIPCYNSEGFIAATINMLLQQDIGKRWLERQYTLHLTTI